MFVLDYCPRQMSRLQLRELRPRSRCGGKQAVKKRVADAKLNGDPLSERPCARTALPGLGAGLNLLATMLPIRADLRFLVDSSAVILCCAGTCCQSGEAGLFGFVVSKIRLLPSNENAICSGMTDARHPLREMYLRARSSVQPSIRFKIGAVRRTMPSVSNPATKCGATTRMSFTDLDIPDQGRSVRARALRA